MVSDWLTEYEFPTNAHKSFEVCS